MSLDTLGLALGFNELWNRRWGHRGTVGHRIFPLCSSFLPLWNVTLRIYAIQSHSNSIPVQLGFSSPQP